MKIQLLNLLVLLNDIQSQFFNLLQELNLEITHIYTILLHICRRLDFR